MSATTYPNPLRPSHPIVYYNQGYFDDSLLNVPQAQDHLVYAGYASLDDALGLDDPYTPQTPPTSSALALQHEYEYTPTRRLAAVTMNMLDDGSGRLRGSAALVAKLSPRLDADADARDASLRHEYEARLFGDASPYRVERALRGYRRPEEKACAIDAREQEEAPRTVRNPTPIKKQPPPPVLEHFGPGVGCSYEGQRPTATLLHCAPIVRAPEPAQCIDPIFLDSSAWDTDYRREGLEIMVGSSYVFPRTDVRAPNALKGVQKRRATAARKVAGAGEKPNAAVKKAAVSRKEKSVKPAQTRPGPRRGSLATRGSMLVY